MSPEERDALCKTTLVNFFNQFTRNQIDGQTAINNDLLLMRSEVPMIVEFLRKSMNVQVTISDIEKYFLAEFNIPFQYTYYRIFKPHKLCKPALTIDHLVTVCNVGYWFDVR